MKKPYILLISALMGAAAFDASAGYKGDLNGDGKVDLADMVHLANAIKSGTADSACDINSSGKVDDTDLHKLADIIISGVLTENEGLNVGIGGWDDDGTDYGGSVKAPARMTRSAEETTFYIKNPKAKDSDGNHSIELGIENATETPSAFLFNIELPGDLNFDDNLIVELENSMMNGHILYGVPKIKEVGEWDWEKIKVLRFIIFTPEPKTINNPTGTLGRIHYSCNETSGAPKFVNCQVLNESGTVVNVAEHSSDWFSWREIPVTEISLYESSLELPKNEIYALHANIEPYNASYQDVTWTSSKPNIVSVSQDGVVTALAEGEATITATSVEYPNISASCNVAVPATMIHVIYLNEYSLALIEAETATLIATVYPEDATDKTVTWSSDNTQVATVDTSGKVTAISTGTATITATANDGSGEEASCTVRVLAKIIAAESISISKESAELKVGETVSLSATVLPENATVKTITWSSNLSDIATVDEYGNVTAKAIGTAEITASCGEASASCTVTVVATPVESISLNTESLSLTERETATLIATVTPDNATDKTVTWSSSDSSVASVSNDGIVTAIKVGTATITASADGKSAECSVEVKANFIQVTQISISNSELSLTEDETATLTATVNPDNATDKTVTWSSSNSTVASVENGIVTAVSAGEATITATSSNGITVSCAVTVKAKIIAAESISISKESAELKVGETVSLSATVLPENATVKTITWSSNLSDIATVDEYGNVTAKAIGTAEITASCGEASASCTVTVVATPVESISLNTESLSLTERETATLIATVTPDNATDKTVTWSSSNYSVASVENGIVTAISEGTATITATSSNGITASCTVTVAAKIIYVESITLDNTVLNLTAGGTATLTHTIAPENATDKSVEWTSSDTSVATVDANGNVTVLKEGTCVITVSTLDGSYLSAQCTITGVSGIDMIFSDPDAQADVYNMNGMLVKRGCTRSDLKQLSSGIYILRQTSGASTVYIHRNH